MRKRFVVTALSWLFGVTAAAAQTATSAAGPIRVFLDCNYECDADFTRQEITFVDYVRDRRDADVHILVTTQDTGAGGTEYTIKFIGLGRFEKVEQTLTHVSLPTSTSDERRRAVVEVLKRGLVRYVAESPLATRLRISLAADETKGAGPQAPKDDPWNLWVFRMNFGGSFNGEQSTSSESLRASISANRTTDAWKIDVFASGNRRVSTYDLGDGEIYEARSHDFTTNGWIVKSMTTHWSAAVNARLSSSTYVNQDWATRFAGGIEYDIFPYSESTRRLLTLQYTLGAASFDYREETIYGKTSENHMDHRVQTSLSMRQPWGSAFASVYIAQFLTEADKYSITAYGDTSVRLFKGFSFNVFGEVARTRDQLYLPKGEATTEEILVRQRQLETGYRYYLSFGISYQFGSIYNNVVNPRFGT